MGHVRRWTRLFLGGAVALTLVAVLTPPASSGPVARATLPAQGGKLSYPSGITVGPDGRLWYTANVAPEPTSAGAGDGRAGAVTPAGPTVQTSSLSNEIFSGVDIAADDTHLWYVDKFYGSVVRVTTGGVRTVFDEPNPQRLSRPEGIAIGPDDNVWVASDSDAAVQPAANDTPAVISRLDPGSTPELSTWTHFSTGPIGGPSYCHVARDITAGPDGNLWATCQLNNRILRITPSGVITTYPLPEGTSSPLRIAAGHDGRLWFTTRSNQIGAIDPTTGEVEAFRLPGTPPLGGLFKLSEIVAGPGGDMWFTSKNTNQIGRITTRGVITRYTVTSGSSTPTGPAGITTLGDDVWLAAENSRQIIRWAPGSRFTDVSFAHPFYDEVEWLATQAITTGNAPALYKPNDAVSRGAMSAFLYRLAGEPAFSPPGSPTFVDVPPSYAFFEEVEWMSAEGITNGFPGNQYRPGTSVNRQAMSAFMYRFAGEPAFSPPGAATFSDVSTAHPFFAEIEWMAAEGITLGNGDGTYRPNSAVSRQAMAAFMFRLDGVLQP